ncbi:MAG: iron-sulfur cluster assembly scaffold protein [Planctomycetes bacterium]|nr:iron-sulfur cluster assembly scaffold protein [Planctomycetota bacterium]
MYYKDLSQITPTGRLFQVPTLPAALELAFRSPRHGGGLVAADARGRAANAACGDELELEFQVRDGRITAAGFRVRGCSGLIACAELLCVDLEGRSCADARGYDLAARVSELGGLPPARRHALEVCRRALEQAFPATPA